MSLASRGAADVARVTLAVAFLCALVGVSLWVILPFLGAAIWATMIVVSTWGGMLRLQALLWNQRWLAVTMLSVALLLVLFVPLSLAIVAVVDHADEIIIWIASLQSLHLPPPPAWVAEIPVIGPKAAELWQRAVTSGVGGLTRNAKPYAAMIVSWLAARLGGVGWLLLQFLLTVLIAAIMYSTGEKAARMLRRFGRRLAGERGEDAVILAARAIRGVALGVVVTALVQSALTGIALALAGVPFAALLAGVTFMLCVAQIGPLPVLAPAVGWLYWADHFGWATFLLVCTVVVTTCDNVLRPFLIKQGADLPLLLIFAGVIGGLISFGLVGIFVGPVVLAVCYTLLDAWVKEEGPRSPSQWADKP